jgi:hypothetical protein
VRSILQGPFYPHDRLVVSGSRGLTSEFYLAQRPKIIVGLSLMLPDEDISSSKFIIPAVLDTGFNQMLMIDERHLLSWNGTVRTYFEPARPREEGVSYEFLKVRIALHLGPYVGFEYDQKQRVRMLDRCDEMIVMDATGHEPYPRLPLLGLKALMQEQMVLHIDAAAQRFDLLA